MRSSPEIAGGSDFRVLPATRVGQRGYLRHMGWRVVLIADVPNLVVGGRLSERLKALHAVIESRGGARRSITLTLKGQAADDAGERAAETIRRTLGPELVGDVMIESIEPEYPES